MTDVANLTDERLAEAYQAGWVRVREAHSALEPLLLELVTRTVRKHVPNATVIQLEATDQGGNGWVFCGVADVDGQLGADDKRVDALRDDDGLWQLLDAYGEFAPSGDLPDPYELTLNEVQP